MKNQHLHIALSTAAIITENSFISQMISIKTWITAGFPIFFSQSNNLITFHYCSQLTYSARRFHIMLRCEMLLRIPTESKDILIKKDSLEFKSEK